MDLKICSLNVRGLGDRLKRRKTFNWLRAKKFSIYLLQETHCSENTTATWSSEWGYKTLFSCCSSASEGTLRRQCKFSCLSRFGIVHKIVKVHLTPKFFFSLNRIYLLFEAFARKSFWICLNSRFSMPSQSRAWSVAWPSFRESGAAVADDVYPGTKHNGTSVCSLYLLEKMESKINRSNIFWD